MTASVLKQDPNTEKVKIFCCLTSTEARRPIRDGDEWERGDRRVKPQNRCQPGRPVLPWTPRQNHRMLWQCPSSIAQCHTIAVPTAMQNRVTMTMSVAPLLGNNWNRRSPTLSLWPNTTSLLLLSSGLASSWESSSPPSSWSRLAGLCCM